MPRFYFDVEVLGLMELSTEGEDFPDLLTAIAAANECAMEMVAEDLARGDGAGHAPASAAHNDPPRLGYSACQDASISADWAGAGFI